MDHTIHKRTRQHRAEAEQQRCTENHQLLAVLVKELLKCLFVALIVSRFSTAFVVVTMAAVTMVVVTVMVMMLRRGVMLLLCRNSRFLHHCIFFLLYVNKLFICYE